jgi:hypothetical protein
LGMTIIDTALNLILLEVRGPQVIWQAHGKLEGKPAAQVSTKQMVTLY